MSKLTFQESELKTGLQDLIRINSSNPTGNERAVCSYFMDILRAENISFTELILTEDRSSLVAHIPASTANATHKSPLVFCGHMDVVPVRAEELERWHYDPWAGEEVDGKIYGRGACDMKSGLWASFYAFVRSKRMQEELALDYDLYFVATCDEEDTMSGIHSVIQSGLVPVGANYIICEPTSLRLASSSRGRSWWKIRISGEAAHGSKREVGLNAIYPAIDLIKTMDREQFVDNAISGKTFWQALEINAGLEPCVVPNICDLTIDARIGLADNCSDVLARFEKHLENIQKAYPRAGFEYTVVDRREPWIAADNERVLQIMREQFAVEEFCFTGSTDGNPLRSSGYPVLIIGPGDLAHAHHCDEYIKIAELYAAEELYSRLIKLY